MVNNIYRYIGKSRTKRRKNRKNTSSILPVVNVWESNIIPQSTIRGGGGGTTKQIKTRKMKHTFSKKDFYSGDGMLTTVWGPSMWHFLHTMSFNYPVSPTPEDKRNYMEFMLSLRNVLPCKYCRMNLTNNFKSKPI